MNLKESIQSRINEARQIRYDISFIGPVDSEGLPFTVIVMVDKEYQKEFEKWLEQEEDNTVAHVSGGNVEY